MTPDEIAALPYRPGVGVMLVNMENRVFVGQRIDNPGPAWQMPQGGIDPGEALDKDIYDLSPEELSNVPALPEDLAGSLQALERDHEFLMQNDVFTEEVIASYIDYKRSAEVDEVRQRPHPYEFMLYYDA